MLLEVKNITIHYYKVPAVRNISIAVEKGKIATLIGSNGAGKTTILRTISGLKHPTTGTIRFRGTNIEKLSAHKVNALGIAMVPEGRRVFPQMTVLENLLIGAYLRKDKARVQKDLEQVVFRHFPRLKERTKQSAGTLSGGEQQMLAIAKAMMSKPKLLMLDEPSLGLAPKVVTTVFEIIAALKAQGVTILLVEQNVHHALRIADRACVIKTGQINMIGTGKTLLSDPQIQKAYLGTLR